MVLDGGGLEKKLESAYIQLRSANSVNTFKSSGIHGLAFQSCVAQAHFELIVIFLLLLSLLCFVMSSNFPCIGTI